MTDLIRKSATRNAIETLQLSTDLIECLEHADGAEFVAEAVARLIDITQQWH